MVRWILFQMVWVTMQKVREPMAVDQMVGGADPGWQIEVLMHIVLMMVYGNLATKLTIKSLCFQNLVLIT